MTQGQIRIRGARQHNLRNLDLDINTGELTVVTGPSGSGKSSLVFDTLYAEGQRRYVETFSAYARQFLDRMDKPAVDNLEGVPPAIAIDQSNPVRTSRSTVGTMTELNDHLKLLFARAGQLFDRETAQPVRHDSPETIYAELLARSGGTEPAPGRPKLASAPLGGSEDTPVPSVGATEPAPGRPKLASAPLGGSEDTPVPSVGALDHRLVVTFPVELPANTSAEQVTEWLSASGFTKIQAEREAGGVKLLDVVADRFRMASVEKSRAIEAIEVALKRSGRMAVYRLVDNAEAEIWQFSTGLHCPDSNLRYSEPLPSMFSFNSPAGACETCRGFGRVIGVDYGLVIPDPKKTLRAGAIKTLQTPAWKEAQDDLMRHAEAAGIPRDTAWNRLTPEQQQWVIGGSPNWKGKWNQQWYGIARFFEYLESKAYKMHIRVLLSKYRSYTQCPTCAGARLKTESLLWRIGSKADADAVLPPAQRFMPQGVAWSREQLEALPGLCLHDLMLLPLSRVRSFFERLSKNTTKLIADGAYGISAGGQSDQKIEASEAPAPSASAARESGDAQALKLLHEEIGTRLKYLDEVGIGYLTLDRQSRTLSGGEVQRINLTTALGTSLVNTLFVLDEPSIGLHPRDMHRITEAMLRLRDAGNTLVVVEHDPAVMLAADRVLDFGPGPGERGGQIVFDGTPDELRRADTLTGQYLGGRKHVGLPFARKVTDATPRLILEGAREHNLKNITVDFPLQRLVTVTGVSGSGKSSLIQDVLAPALMRHFGKATETPGAHDRLLGADHLSDVVFVDQSPIGKTARSNPVSYVGAWDSIRELFAAAPLSRERGYTASKFSFNSGDGRCPTCGGSGFEHVEMQFLSDVYLRCPDCDGKRYRPEILEVTITRKAVAAHAESSPDVSLSVADVLALTVSEAVALFANDREVLRALAPIVEVGLEYVKLGQPVPTLSGGEAQRLKLAGFLAGAAKSQSSSRQPLARRGTLFLFDEPTTGLHFDDIAKLMRAFGRLLDGGNSLIVIEHNLDVIAASDWLIDLGPEGGDGGGELVAEGPPDVVREHPRSHTGAALRDYAAALGAGGSGVSDAMSMLLNQKRLAQAQHALKAKNSIEIVNAREHNLQGLSVEIPRGRFNVITGVSGSGKSTLAFDILFNEGQRRYLESLNAYARSIVQPAGRPEVDAVYGIPPTVAIEQRLSRGGRKSTVGTTTEVWHFLRLLYVKLGTQHCIHDGAAVQPQTPERIAAQLMRQFRGQHIGLLAPLVVARKGVYTELADWARPRGYTHLRVDGNFVPVTPFARLDRFKEHNIELPVWSLDVTPKNEALLREQLARALDLGKGVVHVLSGLDGLAQTLGDGLPTAGIGQLQVISTKRACPVCATSYPELDPRLFSYNSKHGWCPDCVGTGVKLSKEERKVFDDSVQADDQKGREQTFAEPEMDDVQDLACPTCAGTRLNPTARAVQFAGVAITDLAQRSVKDMHAWVQGLDAVESLAETRPAFALSTREAAIARDLLPEIAGRLSFLEQVGLGYLTLERGAPTLSGGEAQRIRLAAQLGSNLQGVCYVLDEPTIGLHARDNQMLLGALRQLSNHGNTLVVVEHDEETIRAADHIIDIGPGAGKRGGTLVAQGTVQDLTAAEGSQTGRYLLHAMRHPLQARRVVADHRQAEQEHASDLIAASEDGISAGGQKGSKSEEPLTWLTVHGAQLHNLQNVTAHVPLGRLVAITGVSGSGKSTLARDVLLTNVQAWVQQRSTKAGRDAMDEGLRAAGPPQGVQTPLGGQRGHAVRSEGAPGLPALIGCAGLSGFETIDRVLEVDQTPIGKTPRSCPATYIGFWDTVRKLYAETLEAKARGYAAGRFSFNTGAGRCAVCEGQGVRTIEMSFLPDVKVPCEACHGARFNPETLAVTWRGKSVGEVLRMEVDEAVDFFAAMPSISHPLQLLKDVGLGYLTLGQPSPTLSGGEAQRIKLVTELTKVRDRDGPLVVPSDDGPPEGDAALLGSGPALRLGRRGQKAPHTLYVLDEPTVGLHMADVDRLIRVLHRLVGAGHSVVVIEHDLDVIAEADWVLDLGPEGGSGGGRIVAAGTPEDVVRAGTPTGVALAPVLVR